MAFAWYLRVVMVGVWGDVVWRAAEKKIGYHGRAYGTQRTMMAGSS